MNRREGLDLQQVQKNFKSKEYSGTQLLGYSGEAVDACLGYSSTWVPK
jgi:hypothetical protein